MTLCSITASNQQTKAYWKSTRTPKKYWDLQFLIYVQDGYVSQTNLYSKETRWKKAKGPTPTNLYIKEIEGYFTRTLKSSFLLKSKLSSIY